MADGFEELISTQDLEKMVATALVKSRKFIGKTLFCFLWNSVADKLLPRMYDIMHLLSEFDDDFQLSLPLRCGNINWAKRLKCNICNTNKPGHSEGGVRGGRGGGYKELDEEEIEETKRRRKEAEDDGEMYDEFGNLKKKYRAKAQQAEAAQSLPGSGRAGWEVDELGMTDRNWREKSKYRSSDHSDTDMSRGREKRGQGYERERHRSRSRERNKDHEKDRSRDRDRDRDYDYERSRDYARDRDRHRDW